MVPDPQRLDKALDRIEGTILPGIAMAIETLLEAVERGEGEQCPRVCSDRLRNLTQQLETLTHAFETAALSPDDDASYSNVGTG